MYNLPAGDVGGVVMGIPEVAVGGDGLGAGPVCKELFIHIHVDTFGINIQYT